ncbi:SAM pointed domain-containing Ets transcription factor isoform X1 [Saccopteryx leptura]|uniref:SAM pointed domain-containing Ets transcription factor isoform X1 n=1 Tax=Saccopteryx leptura TaxID=249018 RepID=UPI00339C9748
MGSASPSSLNSLPPNTVLRTSPEKVTAAVAGPERRDWSPSPPATPEQGLSAFYLSYLDMLYPEDSSWAAKGPGASTRDGPLEPEQCPVIDSQAPGGSLDLAPGGLTLEEHSLEQVQSMVVGEVLKDIETACKLLNITADPVDWSPGNVQKWLLWTEHQYRLPPVGKAFQELGGKELCAMSEDQFRQRSPLGGDVLHAHLDIWKSAAWMKERTSPGAIHFCGEQAPRQGGGWARGSAVEGWPQVPLLPAHRPCPRPPSLDRQRGELGRRRGGLILLGTAHPPVAVPQGAAAQAAQLWSLHPVAQQGQGHLQNRGLRPGGPALGYP